MAKSATLPRSIRTSTGSGWRCHAPGRQASGAIEWRRIGAASGRLTLNRAGMDRDEPVALAVGRASIAVGKRPRTSPCAVASNTTAKTRGERAGQSGKAPVPAARRARRRRRGRAGVRPAHDPRYKDRGPHERARSASSAPSDTTRMLKPSHRARGKHPGQPGAPPGTDQHRGGRGNEEAKEGTGDRENGAVRGDYDDHVRHDGRNAAQRLPRHER